MNIYKSVLILTITLALCSAQACSFKAGGGVDGVSSAESGESPFLVPGVEGDDDAPDVVLVGETDVEEAEEESVEEETTTATSNPVEIITDPADLPTQGYIDQEYDYAEVKAIGGSGDGYNWSATGLPEGLSLVPMYGNTRAIIEGVIEEFGSHEITVTATDPEDATNFDSITYELSIGIGDYDNDPGWESFPECMQPLKIELLDTNGVFYDSTMRGGVARTAEMLGSEEFLKVRITGGKAPYNVIVISQVEDSFHRVNEGTGQFGGKTSIHQLKGITNYRYWDKDAPCITPEEAADMYKRPDYSEFWPDCSNWMYLTNDEAELCEKIGCSQDDWPIGPYGSDEYKLQQQCINGFECPDNFGAVTLTDGQQDACKEFFLWKMQKQKQDEYYGKPKYVCKWTKNPNWRLEGKPAPDPDGPPVVNNILKIAGSIPFTIVSEVEFDGPIPVNRSAYKTDGVQDLSKHPKEKITLLVHDSCSQPNVERKRVLFDIKYPNQNMDEFETKLVYEDLNLYGTGDLGDKDNEKNDIFKLRLFFSSYELPLDSGTSDIAAGSIAESVFNLRELPACYSQAENDEICSEEVGVESGIDSPVKSVSHIYMTLFTGYQKWSNGSDCGVHWGDFDIEDIEIRSKYWYADFNDGDDFNPKQCLNYNPEANHDYPLDYIEECEGDPDWFHSNVNGWGTRKVLLSSFEGMHSGYMNSENTVAKGVFFRRALIYNKWTR